MAATMWRIKLLVAVIAVAFAVRPRTPLLVAAQDETGGTFQSHVHLYEPPLTDAQKRFLVSLQDRIVDADKRCNDDALNILATAAQECEVEIRAARDKAEYQCSSGCWQFMTVVGPYCLKSFHIQFCRLQSLTPEWITNSTDVFLSVVNACRVDGTPEYLPCDEAILPPYPPEPPPAPPPPELLAAPLAFPPSEPVAAPPAEPLTLPPSPILIDPTPPTPISQPVPAPEPAPIPAPEPAPEPAPGTIPATPSFPPAPETGPGPPLPAPADATPPAPLVPAGLGRKLKWLKTAAMLARAAPLDTIGPLDASRIGRKLAFTLYGNAPGSMFPTIPPALAAADLSCGGTHLALDVMMKGGDSCLNALDHTGQLTPDVQAEAFYRCNAYITAVNNNPDTPNCVAALSYVVCSVRNQWVSAGYPESIAVDFANSWTHMMSGTSNKTFSCDEVTAVPPPTASHDTNSTTPPAPYHHDYTSNNDGDHNALVVALSVVGGLVGALLCFGLALLLFVRRMRDDREEPDKKEADKPIEALTKIESVAREESFGDEESMMPGLPRALDVPGSTGGSVHLKRPHSEVFNGLLEGVASVASVNTGVLEAVATVNTVHAISMNGSSHSGSSKGGSGAPPPQPPPEASAASDSPAPAAVERQASLQRPDAPPPAEPSMKDASTSPAIAAPETATAASSKGDNDPLLLNRGLTCRTQPLEVRGFEKHTVNVLHMSDSNATSDAPYFDTMREQSMPMETPSSAPQEGLSSPFPPAAIYDTESYNAGHSGLTSQLDSRTYGMDSTYTSSPNNDPHLRASSMCDPMSMTLSSFETEMNMPSGMVAMNDRLMLAPGPRTQPVNPIGRLNPANWNPMTQTHLMLEELLDGLQTADFFAVKGKQYVLLQDPPRKRTSQGILQHALGADGKHYLIKFFATKRMFDTETSIYKLKDSFSKRTMMPSQVAQIMNNYQKEVCDPHGRPLPPFIIMENCTLLSDMPPLDMPGLAKVMVHTIRALMCLHEANVAHHDLSPHSISRNESQRHWSLMDFGCTASIGELATLPPAWHYIAPEAARAAIAGKGSAITSAAQDVWALGIVAYEMCTQSQVFPDTTPGLRILEALIGRTTLPWESADDTAAQQRFTSQPLELQLVIKRMLVRNASKRATLTDVLPVWISLLGPA